MRVLADADVRALMTPADALAAVEEACLQYGLGRSAVSQPSSLALQGPTPAGANRLVKAARSADLGVSGVRFMGGPRHGAASGARHFYCYVEDYETGAPLGLVDEKWLYCLRTAMSAVVAAKYLARTDSRVAGLIGAGRIANELFPSLAEAFALDDVRVMAKPRENAEAFVERHGPAGLPIRAVATAEEAVRGADIVITLTNATEPFVEPGWLAAGAFLCSMGSYPEIYSGVLAEVDRLFVDDVDYAVTRGDIGAWIAAGEVTRNEIESRLDGHIGEVVAGLKPGRQTPSEKILGVMQGLAVCDLALAKLAIDKANEHGRGADVEL